MVLTRTQKLAAAGQLGVITTSGSQYVAAIKKAAPTRSYQEAYKKIEASNISRNTGVTKSVTSLYQKVDEKLGGILPGGVPFDRREGLTTTEKVILGTTAGIIAAPTIIAGAKAIGTGLLAKTALSKIPTGDDKSMNIYSQLDAILGGVLPGGVAAKDYALGGQYIGKKRTRSKTVPKHVRKWISKTDRRRKMEEKYIRKLLATSGVAKDIRRAAKSKTTGVITRSEAEKALRN